MGQPKKSKKRYRINNIGIGKSSWSRPLIQNYCRAIEKSGIRCPNAQTKRRIILIEFTSAQPENIGWLGRARIYWQHCPSASYLCNQRNGDWWRERDSRKNQEKSKI